MRKPIITINLPEGLPHWAYGEIVAAARVDEGEATIRFRFGDATYWVYQDGSTLSML